MLSIIVAMDPNRLIGKANDLPWHYPEDLLYFKCVTLNHPVLMGSNTYNSIYQRLGKALPNRINYVLTSKNSIPGEGFIVKDLEALIKKYENEELFVIGGAKVFSLLLDRVDRLYITRIHQVYEGDVYFPLYDETKFQLISQTITENCTFEVYERVK